MSFGEEFANPCPHFQKGSFLEGAGGGINFVSLSLFLPLAGKHNSHRNPHLE